MYCTENVNAFICNDLIAFIKMIKIYAYKTTYLYLIYQCARISEQFIGNASIGNLCK